MKDCSGVVIIFNPDVPSHLKEIETWHSMFISTQSLQDSQCLLIAHHKPGTEVEDGRLPLGNHFAAPLKSVPMLLAVSRTNAFYFFNAAPNLSRLPIIHSNLEEEPEDVRHAFYRYLGNVVKAMSESREREEMSIIT